MRHDFLRRRQFCVVSGRRNKEIVLVVKMIDDVYFIKLDVFALKNCIPGNIKTYLGFAILHHLESIYCKMLISLLTGTKNADMSAQKVCSRRQKSFTK